MRLAPGGGVRLALTSCAGRQANRDALEAVKSTRIASTAQRRHLEVTSSENDHRMPLEEYRRKRDPAAYAGAVRATREGPPGARVRRSTPRRTAAALRPAARARRRARELGGAEGGSRAGRAAASGSARRGSPARLRRLRGRDPGRAVRRRHRRDLGSRHLRAARGEAQRRPHGRAPRRAPARRVDARAGRPRRRSPQLAADPQGRRPRRGTRVPADARDVGRAPAGRRGLGLRAEVGRLPRDRHRAGRRSPAHEPERQRPHRAVPRGRTRRGSRAPVSVRGARRRGVLARRRKDARASACCSVAAGRASWCVFDLLELDGERLLDLPLRERREAAAGGSRRAHRRRGALAAVRRRRRACWPQPGSRVSRASSPSGFRRVTSRGGEARTGAR